ncbi:serine threonine-protein kinase [Podochytrium sp. JEL0797]|nr:serine threonine-protein kinase [Podochytrium sp. JEL0797]
MSYLSMLAEKLAEPPRGVYGEGDQIGEWILLKEIGHGSFSRVFLATPAAETELHQLLPSSSKAAIKVVVKAIPDSDFMSRMNTRQDSFASLNSISNSSIRVGASATTADPPSIADDGKACQNDVRRLLDHEITLWASLDHPHILEMIQMMDVDDAVFVVSEFAEGGTLLSHISKYGRLPEPLCKKILHQLVDAVMYLHTIVRVCHRDIKCDNILLMDKPPSTPSISTDDWAPTVKMADFGLSERLPSAPDFPDLPESPSGSLSSASEPQYCVGSVQYCAPEELKSSVTTSTAGDIWSLGCVFYVMLAGALPFYDDYLPRLQMAIMNGEYDESRLTQHKVSEKALRLLRGMLTVDVEKRLSIQDIWEHDFFK